MAADRPYLRPLGFLYGPDADAATAAGEAGRLAGGRIGFTLIELIARREGGRRVELRRYRDLAGSSEASVRDGLARIEAPRAPLCGIDLSGAVVMGILNVTPDSFSDGGEHATQEAAVAHGRELAAAGAQILDVGGESTRPGAEPVALEEELRRVIPVIAALKSVGPPVAVDTRKAEVMRRAVAAGAAIVNDVSALGHDAESLAAVHGLEVPVILMHSQGDPRTMQVNPRYDDALLDIYDALEAAVDRCGRAGIPRSRLIVDPGIGFGKTFDHNLQILAGLSLLHGLGVPLLVGASRKGFIGALAAEPVARRRMPGSVSAALAAILQGIQIVRVHDVRETVQARAVWRGIADAPRTPAATSNASDVARASAPPPSTSPPPPTSPPRKRGSPEAVRYGTAEPRGTP